MKFVEQLKEKLLSQANDILLKSIMTNRRVSFKACNVKAKVANDGKMIAVRLVLRDHDEGEFVSGELYVTLVSPTQVMTHFTFEHTSANTLYPERIILEREKTCNIDSQFAFDVFLADAWSNFHLVTKNDGDSGLSRPFNVASDKFEFRNKAEIRRIGPIGSVIIPKTVLNEENDWKKLIIYPVTVGPINDDIVSINGEDVDNNVLFFWNDGYSSRISDKPSRNAIHRNDKFGHPLETISMENASCALGWVESLGGTQTMAIFQELSERGYEASFAVLPSELGNFSKDRSLCYYGEIVHKKEGDVYRQQLYTDGERVVSVVKHNNNIIYENNFEDYKPEIVNDEFASLKAFL